MKRIYEHRYGLIEGFTKKYGVNKLVWYEIHQSVENAIEREKQIKTWKRSWKLRLIEKEKIPIANVSNKVITKIELIN